MISWNVPPCRISKSSVPFFFFLCRRDVWRRECEGGTYVRTQAQGESLEDPLLLKRNNIPSWIRREVNLNIISLFFFPNHRWLRMVWEMRRSFTVYQMSSEANSVKRREREKNPRPNVEKKMKRMAATSSTITEPMERFFRFGVFASRTVHNPAPPAVTFPRRKVKNGEEEEEIIFFSPCRRMNWIPHQNKII